MLVVIRRNPTSAILSDQAKSLDWRVRRAKRKESVAAQTLVGTEYRLRCTLTRHVLDTRAGERARDAVRARTQRPDTVVARRQEMRLSYASPTMHIATFAVVA